MPSYSLDQTQVVVLLLKSETAAHRFQKGKCRYVTVWRLGSETATINCVTVIPQRTQVPVRVWRLCDGRGRWQKPAVNFWCGNF
jgi:hypothetical protein